MGWYRSMRLVGCLLCLIKFTITQAIAREHSISKHETWFWEHFNLDIAGATSFEPHNDHIIAKNVYFHTNRFYSLIQTTNTTTTATPAALQHSKKFAHNAAITPLPLSNVSAFLTNIKSGWVSGTTLLIPFPEPDFPHHMGHWMEVLAPIYSYLVTRPSDPTKGTNPIRTVVIPNLSRGTVMSSSWVMDLINIATNPNKITDAYEENEQQIKNHDGGGKKDKNRSPPPVRLLFWDDLEHTPLDSWLGFEYIVHVYSRYTTGCGKKDENKEMKIKENSSREEKINGGGSKSGFFSSPEIAENFRLALHKTTGIPPQTPGASLPWTITYLMPTDSSGVTNNKQVLEALQKSTEKASALTNTKISIAVRPYSPTPSVPLASLVAVMSRTGILIGRHAPLLANAVFLPPGAAVIEILPYNWNSGGRSEIYRNLTASRTHYEHYNSSIRSNCDNNDNTNSSSITTLILEKESILHVAWRAPSGDWMRYESDEDSRYSSWTPVECSSEHCIDAHARAGVEVNIEEFQKIVDDVLNVLVVEEEEEKLQRREGRHNGKNIVVGGSTCDSGGASASLSLRRQVREQYPWPRRVELSGTSGLWWDRGG